MDTNRTQCRFCGAKNPIHVSGKTSDMCCVKWGPDKDWADGYTTQLGIPGLASDCGDYLEFQVCLACQRVQEDLTEVSAAKKAKDATEWPLSRKLKDLAERATDLVQWATSLSGAPPQAAQEQWLMRIVNALRAVDRCVPGLVREAERVGSEAQYREAKTQALETLTDEDLSAELARRKKSRKKTA